MKKINFVDTIPENVHRETRLWLMGTTLFCACSLIGIILVNIAQLPELYNTYQELAQLRFQKNNAGTPADEHAQLQTTHKKLSTAVTKLRKTARNPQTPLAYLEAVSSACKADIHLEKVQVSKTNLALSFSCTNPQSITQLTSSLKKSLPQLETLTLTNVQTLRDENSGTRFSCAMKGTLVQKERSS